VLLVNTENVIGRPTPDWWYCYLGLVYD